MINEDFESGFGLGMIVALSVFMMVFFWQEEWWKVLAIKISSLLLAIGAYLNYIQIKREKQSNEVRGQE